MGRLAEIGNCVRLSMNLRQQLEVTFVGQSMNAHSGVRFIEGAHLSACNYLGMRYGGGYGELDKEKMSLKARFELLPD